jgi:hypothetical protein
MLYVLDRLHTFPELPPAFLRLGFQFPHSLSGHQRNDCELLGTSFFFDGFGQRSCMILRAVASQRGRHSLDMLS